MEEFRKFLEVKASKTDIRKVGHYLIWYEKEHVPKATTEFLDMYYLNSKPGSLVVMDSSTARDIEERLKFLEKEVQRLKSKNEILKAIITGLLMILIVALLKIFGV